MLFRSMALPMVQPELGLDESQPGSPVHIDGALTSETAARIPVAVRSVVVDDFTKVFLDRPELAAFTRERSLFVARQIGFAGFVVSCRGLPNEEFLRSLDDQELAAQVCFNPYQAVPGRVA